MFEKSHEPLAALPIFAKRVFYGIISGIIIVSLALSIGIFGYHYFENSNWIDAFNSSALILADMGPVIPLTTEGGKIFVGCYALFSGFFFVTMIGLMLAPIAHRIFHTINRRHSSNASKS
jgi:hypothetical protein